MSRDDGTKQDGSTLFVKSVALSARQLEKAHMAATGSMATTPDNGHIAASTATTIDRKSELGESLL
jgi:hypothetical protein